MGYSVSAATKHLHLLAHLDRWMDIQGVGLDELATARTEGFFRRRRADGRPNLRTRRSLDPLLTYLRGAGVLVDSVIEAPVGPLDVFARDYGSYLTVERGVVDGTARMYTRVARQLAERHSGPVGIDWASLRSGDVTDFVSVACKGKSLSTARQVVSAVRCMLRYLVLEGLTEFALDDAVLSVSGRSPLPPPAVAPAVIAALLESCDRQSAMGQRDRAILVLLSRLGLRGGEVVALTIDDIDWRAGEIVVNGKGGRRDRLPLLPEVGEALAEYLEHGRPQVEDRSVFLRQSAPIRGLAATGAIRSLVVAACLRSGLEPLRPHLLRHSLATEMLRAGTSLRDIGQVVGHQSVGATAVYAKVDLAGLRSLAQPWPGELA